MLEAGAPIPDVQVWRAVEPAISLTEALGDGLTLLCFYLWDWSPT